MRVQVWGNKPAGEWQMSAKEHYSRGQGLWVSSYLSKTIAGIARVFSKVISRDIVKHQAWCHPPISIVLYHHGEVTFWPDNGGAQGWPKPVPGHRGDWGCSHLAAEGGGVARGLSDDQLGGDDGGAVLHQQGDIHWLWSTGHRTNINTRIRAVYSDQGEFLAILDNRGHWNNK